MAIFVVCPGCKKRFSVSDKFAGQTGPCPNCKATIRIPTPEEEVKIHAPTQFAEGGRSVDGQLLTKPIARKEEKWTATRILAIVGTSVGVLIVTAAGGAAGLFAESLAAQLVGLLVVTPLLVSVGYVFLRPKEDLAPLSGRPLYIRSAICAVIYVVLWLAFEWTAGEFVTEELWTWLFVLPPFFLLGGLVAFGSLDMDFGSGMAHFTLFALVVVLLRGLAGVGWIWTIAQEEPLI